MDKKNLKPKISVFLATSLDGYIATEEGNLDWLDVVYMNDEDFGFRNFLLNIDVIVMGRKTYEVVNGFSNWPYKGKRVIVLSKTLKAVRKDAELYDGDILELVEILGKEGAKHVWVDGGETIAEFLRLSLIERMTVSTIPVILGKGIPLFHKMETGCNCRLLSTHAYESGLVQNCYQLLKTEIYVQ
ncbi:MAG: dihydrofolate reductase family protein [Parachlamydiales bacterium]|jgi:dihydrofolate reductase